MLNLTPVINSIEYSLSTETVLMIEIFCKYRDLKREYREEEIIKYMEIITNLKKEKTKDIRFHLDNIDYFVRFTDLINNYSNFKQYTDYRPRWSSKAWYVPKSVSNKECEISTNMLETLFEKSIDDTSSFFHIENISIENFSEKLNDYDKYRYRHITYPKITSIFPKPISESHKDMKIGIEYVKEYISSSKEIEKLEFLIKVLSSMRSDKEFFKLLLQEIDQKQSYSNDLRSILNDVNKVFLNH